MTPTTSITTHTLRHTLRSPLILTLLTLLLPATLLLPLAIRHDGTPDGLIRLHLTYTLGIPGFLLTLATLWAGCAAIAREADDKTLQLLLVKPVPRFSIWLGKWLALVILNALLLALVGGLGLLSLRASLRRANFAPDDLARTGATTLTALDTAYAPLPDIEAQVRATYQALLADNRLPPAHDPAQILDALRRDLLHRHYSIAPGQTLVWNFPPLPPATGQLLVHFRCDASIPGVSQLDATLELHLPDAPPIRRDILATPGVPQTIIFSNLPPLASVPVTPAIHFHNRDTHQATLFFDPQAGLVLRRPAGRFTANYLRALALLFLRLALFAAIGVTLGTLFSTPVAAFLGLVLILILQLSGFIHAAAQTDRQTFVANVAAFGHSEHHHDTTVPAPTEPGIAARTTANLLYYAYRGTWLTLRPLIDYHATDDLVAANRIPPATVIRTLLQQGLLLPLLLGLLSTAVLKQREWALPTPT